jgi:hypothetical protein
MDQKVFRFIWLAILSLIVATLACNSLTAIGEDYEQVRSTAESIATQAQRMITQVEGIATEIGESDTLSTARAIATREGPSLIATGEALATQAAEGGFLETAGAFITQESGDLMATIQAIEPDAFLPGNHPADIPLLAEETRSQFFANESVVSYVTTVGLQTAIDIYSTAMPFNGWEAISEGTVKTEDAAVLRYAKPDRLATVTLTTNPLNRQTVVLITITPR